MLKKITKNPFYDGLLKDAKRKVHNAQNEVNRRNHEPNADRKLYEAKQELSNLLSQLRHNGYNV